MSTYKLTYFDCMGFGEMSRILLEIGGVQWTDERLPLGNGSQPSEQWAKLKPTCPFGHIPILEVDGFMLAESSAIQRFLARRFNLMGSGEFEEALVNSVLGANDDVGQKVYKVMKDPVKMKEFMEGEYIEAMRYYERFAEKHGSDGHFVGKSMTLADISFAYWAYTLDPGVREQTYSQFPHLLRILEAFRSHERVDGWYKKRPVTPF